MLAKTTILFGIFMVIIGLIGYANSQSPTALIPSMLGLMLMALGALSFKESRRKVAMHLAAFIALLGLLATLRGLTQLPALLSGEPLARPMAVQMQSITAILCAAFLLLCAKSFVDARRLRK